MFVFCDWPGVDLRYGNAKSGGDVLNSLVSLGDDSYTLGNSLGCDGVITCDHDNLQDRQET